MNTQPIEKAERNASGLIAVHSIFHTIQGEGPFCGTPSVFVRLAGCNLQCPKCDTDYTSGRAFLDVEQVLDIVDTNFRDTNDWRCGLVVITGGEPFRQQIGGLIDYLVEHGYYVQVETNGTLPPPVSENWSTDCWERSGAYIVCSPKTGSVHPKIEQLACCFKYVMSADSVDPVDGLPVLALDHSAKPRLARPLKGRGLPIYLQPVDDKNDEVNLRNVQAVRDSCLRHGYILQLQIHKILGVP